MARRNILAWVVCFLSLQVTGCTHTALSWKRTGQAAQEAVTHPSVWMPVAGASLFAFEDFDNQVANHLSNHEPVFGSGDAASSAGNELKTLLTYSAIASAFVAPAPTETDRVSHTAEHLAVVIGGLKLTELTTQQIKQATDRQRPNGTSDSSFPSGHASQSFAAATFTSANIHRAWGDSSATTWIDAGVYTAAGLTAYSRVEGGYHHPSDVLVGVALGNFLARFLDNLLLDDEIPVTVSAYADTESVWFGVQYGF